MNYTKANIINAKTQRAQRKLRNVFPGALYVVTFSGVTVARFMIVEKEEILHER